MRWEARGCAATAWWGAASSICPKQHAAFLHSSHLAFSPSALLKSRWYSHSIVLIWLQLSQQTILSFVFSWESYLISECVIEHFSCVLVSYWLYLLESPCVVVVDELDCDIVAVLTLPPEVFLTIYLYTLIYYIYLCISQLLYNIGTVGWSYRIHWLHLCRGVRLFHKVSRIWH